MCAAMNGYDPVVRLLLAVPFLDVHAQSKVCEGALCGALSEFVVIPGSQRKVDFSGPCHIGTLRDPQRAMQ